MKSLHHLRIAFCAWFATAASAWAECPCAKGMPAMLPAPQGAYPVSQLQPSSNYGYLAYRQPTYGQQVSNQQIDPALNGAPQPMLGQPQPLPSAPPPPVPANPAVPAPPENSQPATTIMPNSRPANPVPAVNGEKKKLTTNTVIQSEEDKLREKRNQSLPYEMRSNASNTALKKHHETDPPSHFTYGDGLTPPPGNLGRTYKTHSEPMAIDKSPRGAVVRIRLPEEATISSPGMKVKWTGRFWELEPEEALLPGVPSVITVKATVPTENGDVTTMKWIRLWWNRTIEVDF